MFEDRVYPTWRRILGGLISFAAGLFVIVRAVPPLYFCVVSAGWPTVPGVVKESRMDSWYSRGNTTYGVWVVFDYEYEGRAYEARTPSFLGELPFSKPGPASEATEKYAPGSAVSVRVDPGNPARAVIDRRAPWWLWPASVFGIPFVLVGVGILFFPKQFRGRAKRR